MIYEREVHFSDKDYENQTYFPGILIVRKKKKAGGGGDSDNNNI